MTFKTQAKGYELDPEVSREPWKVFEQMMGWSKLSVDV